MMRMLPLTASTISAPQSHGMNRRDRVAMLLRVPASPSRRKSNIAIDARTTEIARICAICTVGMIQNTF